jgi:TPR repeat protein
MVMVLYIAADAEAQESPGLTAHELPALVTACEQGKDGLACYVAANAYERGHVVAKDPERALEFFVRGCAAGEPAACVSSERWIGRGRRYRGDSRRAALEQACARNIADACVVLGVLLEAGNSRPQAARAAYRRACDLGVARACGTHKRVAAPSVPLSRAQERPNV